MHRSFPSFPFPFWHALPSRDSMPETPLGGWSGCCVLVPPTSNLFNRLQFYKHPEPTRVPSERFEVERTSVKMLSWPDGKRALARDEQSFESHGPMAPFAPNYVAERFLVVCRSSSPAPKRRLEFVYGALALRCIAGWPGAGENTNHRPHASRHPG